MEKIKKYYLYFMMYAFIGWFYEVFLEVVVYQWGYNDRGILFGPYCPVYGVGALAFIFTMGYLIKNKNWKQKIFLLPFVFVGCMGIATLIELIASYLCEWLMGSWPWQTYADYKYNFQARIALSPSIRFGIGGVLFLYLLQPLFEKVVNKLSNMWLNILAYSIGLLFILDIFFKIIFIIV